MRYLFVDRIVTLESGRRIVAEKLVSRTEVHGRRLRASQILETMAQAAGWLAKESHAFARLPLLAKVPELEILRRPQAGEKLRVEARVDGRVSDCLSLSVTLEAEGELVARGQLLLYLLQPPAERGSELADLAREHFHYLTQAPTRRVLSSLQ
jgi:3-hydroxymyristoyl/3-hydroxydecanoyl-(acyl carrier protein) dehydratase